MASLVTPISSAKKRRKRKPKPDDDIREVLHRLANSNPKGFIRELQRYPEAFYIGQHNDCIYDVRLVRQLKRSEQIDWLTSSGVPYDKWHPDTQKFLDEALKEHSKARNEGRW